MTNIAFLFGAGSEGKDNYNLKTGISFLRSSFAPNNRTQILNGIASCVLRTGQDNSYVPGKDVFSSDQLLSSFLFTRAYQDRSFCNQYKKIILWYLNNDEISILNKHHKDGNNSFISRKNAPHKRDEKNKKYYKKLSDEFERLLSIPSCKYKGIKYAVLKQLFSEDKDGLCKLNEGVSCGQILDSHFHSFIDPRKYSNVYYSRVFNYYWFCYFAIVEDLLNIASSSVQKEYKKDGKPDYELIIKNNEKFTHALYSDVYNCGDTYYKLLGAKINGEKNKYTLVGCITTNYFDFCRRDMKIDDIKTAFLNGKLSYFEYPEIISVIDHNVKSMILDKVFFPFVFGQSTIKPIVHPLQIYEYEKCNKILSEADVLVVLGYGINEDDNHVNAYVRDYVEKESKRLLVVTDKENTTEEMIKRKIATTLKLKDESSIELVIVSYGDNNEVVNRIFQAIEEGK